MSNLYAEGMKILGSAMTIDTQNFNDWKDHPERFWVQEEDGVWRAGTSNDVKFGMKPYSRRIANKWGHALKPNEVKNELR